MSGFAREIAKVTPESIETPRSEFVKRLAAQQLSEGTTVVAPSRRAAVHVLAINPWLDGTGTGVCMYVKTDAIAFTSKHRLRRPPDSSH